MMSPFPWKLDGDGDKIYDADGEIIAENYRFVHLDDFEGLVKMVNSAYEHGINKNRIAGQI